MTEKTLWGIHAGKTGDADSLFLKRNFVALGWLEMGDVSKLPPDRETFYQKGLGSPKGVGVRLEY